MVGLGSIRGRTRRFAHDNSRTFPLPVNIEPPTLDNYTPIVGDFVSVFDPGEWSATPAVDRYSYQRQLDRVNSGAQTNNVTGYVTQAADAGKRLRWGVYAWNTAGRSVLISYTVETEPIVGVGALPLPVNVTPPSIQGMVPPVEGQTATVAAGSWNSPPYTLATKWQREGAADVWADIAGATGIFYTYVAGDVTHRVRVGQLATNATGAAAAGYTFSTPTLAVEATPPVGTRIAGLGWTPDYVDPDGTRPATFAAAEIFAAAHPELYPTGLINVNSYANFEAGIDAANAADKSLAIGIDNDVGHYTISATKRYLKRGLIGFGGANPDITFARTSANWYQSPHLFVHTQDIAMRFIKWINTDIILVFTHPSIVRIKNGQASLQSWQGPGMPKTISDPSQNAVNFIAPRCGKVTPTGSGNITSMYMVREIEGIEVEVGQTFEMAGKLEQIALISGTITSVTPTKIRDAINALTGTHGVAALLSDDGLSVLITKAVKGYPLELVCVCTDSLVCGTDPLFPWKQDENNNTWGPGFDLQYNEFVDCNQVIGGRSDVTAVGPIKFCKNDMPGTWGGYFFMATRYSRIWAANNHWRDCTVTRPAAAGRTSSRQPNGDQSNYNTFGGITASGSPFYKRYASVVLMMENNEIFEVESDNIQFNYNSAVFCHHIGGWDRPVINGVVSSGYAKHSWNKAFKQHRQNGGDDDGAWAYGNTNGLVIEHNVFDQVGEGYARTGFVGTEATLTFKESGALSLTEQGMRAIRVLRQRSGIPFCKYDHKGNQVHEQLYLEEFDCTKGGVPYINNLNSGCLTFLGTMYTFALRQVFIKNHNFYPDVQAPNPNGKGHGITFGRVVATNIDWTKFELNNIYFQNDGSAEYPEYTGDTELIMFTFGAFPVGQTVSTVAADFRAKMKMRDCYVLNAAGTIVGNVTGRLWPDGIVGPTFGPNGLGEALPRLTSVDTDGIPQFGAVW